MERKKLVGAITSEDVLGKDVFDSDGVLLGVSDKFYLHPTSLKVLGLSIDKGFLRSGLIISTDHVREVSTHAVFLNSQLYTRVRGMHVFDSNGARVGKVKHIELLNDTNALAAVFVKTGFFHNGKLRIPRQHIKSTQKNVLLNITKAQVQEKEREAKKAAHSKKK